MHARRDMTVGLSGSDPQGAQALPDSSPSCAHSVIAQSMAPAIVTARQQRRRWYCAIPLLTT